MRQAFALNRLAFLWTLGFSQILYTTGVHAWGRTGHQIIGEIAAELAPAGQDFWLANKGNLGTLANVPDSVWKSGSGSSQEKPTHWFHADAYTQAPWKLPSVFETFSAAVNEYGQATIQENGTAYWRAQQFFDDAIYFLQIKDDSRALQMAGVLAHYVGDLAQPLHVTIDYDGANSNQSGIHSFFESMNVDSIDFSSLKLKVKNRAISLLASPKFARQSTWTIQSIMAAEIARSADFIQEVLANDDAYGRQGQGSQVQLELAIDRMADGVATLALIYGKIIVDSSSNPSPRVLRSETPLWVAPSYQFGAFAPIEMRSHHDDDCEK